MASYIDSITLSLQQQIDELSQNPSLFLRNPKSDFSRNRKIDFKTFVGITTNSGGGTMSKELLDYFDFLPLGSSDTYPISFRIVRFPISENAYELVITNLDRHHFSAEKLKDLYHLRWGIETSFRELKYAIGLTSFHARKPDFIKQEIFARLLLYNYCELITTHVINQMDKADKITSYMMPFYLL